MTADEQGGDVVPLHAHAGKTEASRARQRANLKPAAAKSHGAYSEAATRAARERFLFELQELFPGAAGHLLLLQAQRLAQLQQLGDYLDEKGLIRHRKYGTVRPAGQLAEKIATSAERAHLLLEGQQREAGNAGETLESYIAANYGADGEQADEVLEADGDDAADVIDDVVGTDVDGGDGDG